MGDAVNFLKIVAIGINPFGFCLILCWHRLRRLLPLLLLIACARAQTTYWLDSSPFTDATGGGTKGAVDYVFTSNWTNSGHVGYGMNPGSDIRFSTNSAAITILIRENSQQLVIYQDGVQLGSPVTIPGGFSESDVTIATGLDTGSVHDYKIVFATLDVVNNSFLYNVQLSGAGIANVAHFQPAIEYEYGDSRTYQKGLVDQGGQLVENGHCYNNGIAAGGYEGWNTDGSGKQVYTFLRDNTAEIPAGATRVWLGGGINDYSNSVSSGNFQTAYQAMLAAVRTQIGAGKPIICLQPFCTPNFTQSPLNTWGGYIQAAITATGDANTTYVQTSGWITQTATYSADGTHLTAAGEAQLQNRLAPIAAPHAISISGPSSGANGVASTNFTVTLAASATFTGDQTVTIADGSKGGTITPSVGSPGTSTVTVTPTASTTSFTFTYTPAVAAIITLTPTAAQAGWTMPSGPAYRSGGSISAGALTAGTVTHP